MTFWLDFYSRFRKEQDNHDWLKVHIVTGIKTNIITAVEITGRHDHDSPQFAPMVEATAKNFTLERVTADKAYLSGKNMELVASFGGTAFIPFKSNATGETSGSALFEKMFHYFQFNREEFLGFYHQRSNVESTVNMVKAKFGGSIRSRTETAQHNEVLCKILCHNLCVIIQSIFELQVEPVFWKDAAALPA